MERMKERIEKSLFHVLRPGRYWGNELNAIHKDPDKVDVNFVLAFPDLYEIGMSHIGFSILYHVLNSKKWISCERVYSPWTDMEEEMLKRNIPLFSLESKTPVRDFDILGITLQYELQYTNVLNILYLAGIPIFSRDRKSGDPIVIAGGPCALNPEPMVDFIDAFVLGDGEEVVIELVEKVRHAKEKKYSRKTILREIAEIQGVYVPSVHDKKDDFKVVMRIIDGLHEEYYPENLLVPLIEITHDRFSLEVMRGCTRGCRFCSAGMGYRPVRERDPDKAFSHARKVIESTGYEEISLVSLSTSDYSGLPRLLTLLTGGFRAKPVSIAFPSLRPETFTDEMAKIATDVRKTSLTLAPEAGTQRLRDVINKNNSEEDLLNAVDIGFRNGFKRVKLYFMIGLPTETDDDILGIGSLVTKVAKRVRQYGRTDVHVSISPFSPKPHTPFQWEVQDSIETLNRKITLLRKAVPSRGVTLKWRDPRISFLETVLGQGDRALGRVIKRAWEKGVRFDAWSEYFNRNYSLWQDAFVEEDIDPEKYSCARDPEEPLPWDYVDIGVTKAFLKKERERALSVETTYDCRISGCNFCGLMNHPVCRNLETKESIVDWSRADLNFKRGVKKVGQDIVIRKVRIAYSKDEEARFTSHLDTMRLFVRALRRGNIRVAYSKGYHSHPKISPGPPLSLGFTSSAEYMDLEIEENIPAKLQYVLNNYLPTGIRVFDMKPISHKVESLSSAIGLAVYKVRFSDSADTNKIRENITDFLQKNSFTVVRKKKGRSVKIDIRLFVKDISLRDNVITLYLNTGNRGSARVNEILCPIFQDSNFDFTESDVKRTGLFSEKNGKWVTPMEIV